MTRHRTNAPRVASETLDGEVLLIDMTTGAYFSCVDASAVVWTLLANGATRDEAVAALVGRYEVPEDEAGAAYDALLDAGLADELLRPRDEGEGAEPELLAGFDGVEHAWGPVELEKSTEIADLILLDPVHDVTDAGWPNTR
jgi:hypothetical protein